jgi:CDP-glucose 4,6-dehydratase
VAIDPDFWRDRRVLITGHTGFKGVWLSLWLQSLGAKLTGLSRSVPDATSLYGLCDIGEHMRELAVDVRDGRGVREAITASGAEIVVHLAAQPVVRRSLLDPALTYEVNVMGTVNVLEAVRQAGAQVRAVLVVTSDKCYENPGDSSKRFRESDPLGGDDPYSSSKACAELVSAAYRRSFFAGQDAPRLATARAGNVIGGGDRGEDRLLPDAVRALEAGGELLVRNPRAVRPWQHVINPLGGYLLLAQALCEGTEAARAWNFGPRPGDAMPVEWIVGRLSELWRGELRWEIDGRANPPEAVRLELDSGDSERELGWRPAVELEQALELFVDWQAARTAGRDMRLFTLGQIERHA